MTIMPIHQICFCIDGKAKQSAWENKKESEEEKHWCVSAKLNSNKEAVEYVNSVMVR